MTRKAFEKIAAGLRDVDRILNKKGKPPRLHVPIDVQSIRHNIGLSQVEFAERFGFSIDQIRAWEQGKSQPRGGVRTYLLIIEHDPKNVGAIYDRVNESATA